MLTAAAALPAPRASAPTRPVPQAPNLLFCASPWSSASCQTSTLYTSDVRGTSSSVPDALPPLLLQLNANRLDALAVDVAVALADAGRRPARERGCAGVSGGDDGRVTSTSRRASSGGGSAGGSSAVEVGHATWLACWLTGAGAPMGGRAGHPPASLAPPPHTDVPQCSVFLKKESSLTGTRRCRACRRGRRTRRHQ